MFLFNSLLFDFDCLSMGKASLYRGAAFFYLLLSLVVSLCVRVGESYPPFLFALAVLVSMGSGRLCKVL